MKFRIWDFMKICGEIPNLVKATKILVTLLEDLRTFYFCRRYKCAIKHFCATLGAFILLTVTLAKNYTERIVAVPLQQWLRERATVVRYTYIAYFVRSSFSAAIVSCSCRPSDVRHVIRLNESFVDMMINIAYHFPKSNFNRAPRSYLLCLLRCAYQ